MFIYSFPSEGDPNKSQAATISPGLQEKIIEEQLPANLASIKAITTLNEAQLMMNGLKELREALCYGQVKHDDTGQGERPAVKPIFSEQNQEKLQFAYLNLYMRYAKYVDHTLNRLNVPTPNKDIEPKKDES